LKFVKVNKLNIFEAFLLTYYFAGDWKLTDKIIKTHLANRPAITIEEYPNKNKARITLATVHPQYMIWEGGKIVEKNDTEFNYLGAGLYKWEDINRLSDPIDYYITNTWWLVRRLVAWTAKIDDNCLPPIKKQKLTDNEKKIIMKNIFWDGTVNNLIENI
jgi:hypothetical protein